MTGKIEEDGCLVCDLCGLRFYDFGLYGAHRCVGKLKGSKLGNAALRVVGYGVLFATLDGAENPFDPMPEENPSDAVALLRSWARVNKGRYVQIRLGNKEVELWEKNGLVPLGKGIGDTLSEAVCRAVVSTGNWGLDEAKG